MRVIRCMRDDEDEDEEAYKDRLAADQRGKADNNRAPEYTGQDGYDGAAIVVQARSLTRFHEVMTG